MRLINPSMIVNKEQTVTLNGQQHKMQLCQQTFPLNSNNPPKTIYKQLKIARKTDIVIETFFVTFTIFVTS